MRILSVLALILASSTVAGAQIRFVTCDGPLGSAVTYALDGFVATPETEGTGTASFLVGERKVQFPVTWIVLGDGDVVITCGACRRLTVLRGGARAETGAGDESHVLGGDVRSEEVVWTNIDFR